MQEQDRDRLEEFFRKAAVRSEVPFNEEDWKKLEARLDAADAANPVPVVKSRVGTYTAAAVAGLVLLAALWWTHQYVSRGSVTAETVVENSPSTGQEPRTGATSRSAAAPGQTAAPLDASKPAADTGAALKEPRNNDAALGNTDRTVERAEANNAAQPVDNRTLRTSDSQEVTAAATPGGLREGDGAVRVTALDREKVRRDLIAMPDPNESKIKQKAKVDLPGAEEVNAGEAIADVAEEETSVPSVAPRLSLLLSFAPDFTSTSNRYQAPGKAFGAVLHYHFLSRWSVFAGVIRNNKQYVGDGEDYTPPLGYWKRNTNGVIPSSIDGSCSVLEFPLMVQYTVASGNKHRWLVSAGTSSYLMLSESYRYQFEEPNPGAASGWDSRNSDRFYFNMINFALGYEREVLPGVMLGLEPYVKIPIEEIGWVNLKLFSTGASVTLRYKLLGRRPVSLSSRSRPPD